LKTHAYKTSLLIAILGSLFLLLPIHAQEEFPYDYPPEIGIPPEPPANDCDCKFMAYIQPSQGVLQDDPRDTNFLEIRRGPSTLAEAMPTAPLQFAFRIPTLGAGIPMVIDRDTYLLAANPYDPSQKVATALGDAYPMATENITKLTFTGTTRYTRQVDVDVRITVLNKRRRIKQFLANNSPLKIYLDGPCGSEKPLDVSSNLLEKTPRDALKFKLASPGNYRVRAELVYHDPNQTDLTKLRPTGLAVDVLGNAVKTKAPSLAFVPIPGNNAAGTSQQAFVNLINSAASKVGANMQDYFAIPSKTVTPKVSPVTLRPRDFTGLIQAFAIFKAAKRQSKVASRPDRLMVIFEDQAFQGLLDSWFANHPNNYDPGALSLAIFKDILFIRGPHRASSPSVAVPYYYQLGRYPDPEILIHRGLISSFDFIWVPEAGKMGDCKVDPYHDILTKTAYGLALRHPNGATPYAVKRDVMEYYPQSVTPNLCQCTYRHSLEALSKTAIDPPMLLVSGSIENNGLLFTEATLDPLYQIDGFPELSEQGTGKYAIVLKDTFDQVIAEYPFSVDFETPVGTLNEMAFNYTIDLPPGLARVEITGPVYYIGGPGREVLDAIDISPHPPYLFNFERQLTLNGITYSWQGYDFDGDPILYSLYASEDGEVFYPTGVHESPQTSAVLKLPPTIRFLKLVATDGGRSQSTIMPL